METEFGIWSSYSLFQYSFIYFLVHFWLCNHWSCTKRECVGMHEEGKKWRMRKKLKNGYLTCMLTFHEGNLGSESFKNFSNSILMSLGDFNNICSRVFICPPNLQKLLFILIYSCVIHCSAFSEPAFPLRAPVPKWLSNAVWPERMPRLPALFTTFNDE